MVIQSHPGLQSSNPNNWPATHTEEETSSTNIWLGERSCIQNETRAGNQSCAPLPGTAIPQRVPVGVLHHNPYSGWLTVPRDRVGGWWQNWAGYYIFMATNEVGNISFIYRQAAYPFLWNVRMVFLSPAPPPRGPLFLLLVYDGEEVRIRVTHGISQPV